MHSQLREIGSNLGRYVSLIAVISAGMGSALMFLIGTVKVYHAYEHFIEAFLVSGLTQTIGTKQSIAYLIQGIDAFLIALVFKIFAGGVYNIFVHHKDDSPPKDDQTAIRSIAQLKSIIAELIVIILFVSFMEDVLGSDVETYQWEILVIPISVLLLALGLKFLDLKPTRSHPNEPSH